MAESARCNRGRAVSCYDCMDVLDRLRSVSSRPALALLVPLALATAAYWRVLDGEFQFDDLHDIEGNLALKDLGRYLADHLLTDYATGQRPVTYLTFALNYAMAGLVPWNFHLTNLFIHLVAVVLVWGLTLHVLHLAGAARAEWVAVAVASVFALHPIQSEAVSYVVQRYETLGSALYIATLVLLLAAERRGLTRRSAPFWAAAFASFALALGAKQIAVTVPAAWLLIAAAVPTPERRRELVSWRARAIAVLPLVLLGAFFMARALGKISRVGYAGFSVPGLPPGTYFMTELRAIVVYLRLLAWPAGQNVDWDFPVSNALDAAVVLAGAFLLALAAGAVALIALARRWQAEDAAAARVAGFGVLWFFLVLSVTSSFVPLADVLVEHRLYLASWGVFLAAGVGLERALARVGLGRRVPAIAAIAVVAWAAPAAALHRRNAVWESNQALWTDALSKSPRNARAHLSLGYAYRTEARYDEAIEQYRQGLACARGVHMELELLRNLGAAFIVSHRYDEAIDALDQAYAKDPANAEILTNLATAWLSKGNAALASLYARQSLAAAEEADDDRARGSALNILGVVQMEEGDLDAARASIERAIALDPDAGVRHFNQGRVFDRMGDVASACEAWRRAASAHLDVAMRARAAALLASPQCR